MNKKRKRFQEVLGLGRHVALFVILFYSSQAFSDQSGQIGVCARLQVLSGKYLSSQIAPGVMFSYETNGATKSFGLRLDGHFSLRWGDILGGGLGVLFQQQVFSDSSAWHLGLFGGLTLDLHLLSFEPPGDFQMVLSRFVLDLGPRLGMQLGYRKPESSMGWIFVFSGATGFRTFLDGKVESESSWSWSLDASVGIVF